MGHDERLKNIQSATGISDAMITQLKEMDGISFDLANRLVENVISTIAIPVGVVSTNLSIRSGT